MNTLVVGRMKHDYGTRGDQHDLRDVQYLQEIVGAHIIYRRVDTYDVYVYDCVCL